MLVFVEIVVFKIYQFFSTRDFSFLCNNGRLFRIIKLRIGIVGAFTPVFFFLFQKKYKVRPLSVFTKNLVSQRIAENFFIIIIKITILTLESFSYTKIRILLFLFFFTQFF